MQVKIEEVKTMMATASLSNTQMTSLHSAAKRNDLDLIQHLLQDPKCDINEKNSSGTTPLLTALLYNQFEAANFLLNSGADMLIGNNANQNPLRIVLSKRRKTPEHVVKCFIEKLKSDVGDYDEIGEILSRTSCSLESVLLVEDAKLTRALLTNPTFVDEENSLVIVNRVLKSTNLDNLRMILQHGHGAAHRRSLYFRYLSYRTSSNQPNWNFAKRHISQLVEWEIAEEDFLKFWVDLLKKRNSNDMVKLLECVVHVSDDNKYRQYLVAQAFGTLDYEVIVTTLKKFDPNVRGSDGLTALHFAATRGREKNVNYLLKKGADPNVKDDHGRVPLFHTVTTSCVELLLRHGADVQSIDDDGTTVFQYGYFAFEKLDTLQAHLAMIAGRGVPIDPLVYGEVRLRYCYERFCRQIDRMKEHFVVESVTVFDVLVGKPERLFRYVRDRGMIEKVEKYCVEEGFCFYYCCRLTRNLKEALARYEIMSTLAAVMTKITGRPADYDHLVVVNVVRYLNF